jgi:hypothetical protein
MLTPRGDEIPPTPVTLPALRLPEIDKEVIADETRAVAKRIAERRTVRRGRDAWEAISKAESFEGWKAIGAALAVGKHHALKVTGANAAWGRNYSREFSEWIKQHGFERMQKSVRSVAIVLHENAEAITTWRDGLPERQRRRLIHPLSVTRRWRAATGQYQAHRFRDAKLEAGYAWRRFVACVSALPEREAAPLWQAVLAEVHLMT